MTAARWVRALRAMPAVVLCAAFLASPTDTFAAPCAGFTDVDGASAFCPNVEWLRNRGITLGCTSATLYCPGDAVARLAMAAFINRLGNVLTPKVLEADSADTPILVGLSGAGFSNVVCETEDLPAVAYPRLAIAHGFLSATANVTQAIVVDLVASTDSGASWNFLALPLNVSTFGPNAWQSVSSSSTFAIAAGQTVRFGLAPTRYQEADATAMDVMCSTRAIVMNGTEAPAPLSAKRRVRTVVDIPRRTAGPLR